MSRTNEHLHRSRHLHRALGLGLSAMALAGLIYFEGMSARAGTEEVDDEAEAEALVLDEADELEETDASEAAENDVRGANPALMPSGLGEPSRASAPVDAIAPSDLPVAATTPADDQIAQADVAAVDAAAAMPVAPPAPVLVAVPDIEGMSVRKAKKQLAAVGLRLAVRDEYGWKVPRAYWGDYKVRSQKIDAGTEVEAGSMVKVKARMKASVAMGY